MFWRTRCNDFVAHRAQQLDATLADTASATEYHSPFTIATGQALGVLWNWDIQSVKDSEGGSVQADTYGRCLSEGDIAGLWGGYGGVHEKLHLDVRADRSECKWSGHAYS